MSFEEIRSNRDLFLDSYGLREAFDNGPYSWDDIVQIGSDYEAKRNGEYFQLIQNYIAEISAFENVHSYRFRIKRTDSLLAKIIKKAAKREEKITLENYYTEISDLLGIRILYVFKEDYWSIHKQIMEKYKSQLAENVHLKLRDGDDEKTYERMLKSYDIKVEEQKVYRSIHYTIYADPQNIKSKPKIEIQTRTIFEEGWSEINHKLVYKKGSSQLAQLEKNSGILSGLVGSCDAIGSLMKYIYDESLKNDANDSASHHSNETDVVGEAIRKFLLQ